MARAQANDCWIISASRRTDIPAFFTDWLMERINLGWVEVPSPFGGRPQQVCLLPEKVHSIVFWSKDYRPLLPHLDELEARGFNLFFHFTITGLPKILERHVPPWETAADTFLALSDRFGPERIIWRFDPIVFFEASAPSPACEQFSKIADKLKGKVRQCYFSFLAFYPKVIKRLAKMPSLGLDDPPVEIKQELAAKLVKMAADYSIELFSCSNDALLQPGIKKGHCIDGELLSRLFPDKSRVEKINPTRPQCGCYLSKDIGRYNTCRHECLYCYAGT